MDGRGCARPLHRCDGPRAAFYLRGVRRPCERPEQLRGEHRRPYLLHSQPFTRRRVPPLTRNPLGDAQPAMTRCASKAPTPPGRTAEPSPTRSPQAQGNLDPPKYEIGTARPTVEEPTYDNVEGCTENATTSSLRIVDTTLEAEP